MKRQLNFAIIGVGGYVAPRHLKAIYDTGNRVVAALDLSDSVGLLDKYDHDIAFFKEVERFDRHLEKLAQSGSPNKVDYVSICSPNYLHDAHARIALRVGSDVLCEKPLVINPWNLDQLQELESRTGKTINVMLQLRVHPLLLSLRDRLMDATPTDKHEVNLTYITSRGRWYDYSWKGDPSKSGGVSINIGIHFFDLLGWLFGPYQQVRMHLSETRRMSGYIEFERARVRWFLSVDKQDLPFEVIPGEQSTYRLITVDGDAVEFTGGFTDLHTRVYERVLRGEGFGIEDIRQATQLTYEIRTAETQPIDEYAHEMLRA